MMPHLRRRAYRHEEGMAMLTVVMLGLAISAIAMTVMVASVAGLNTASHDKSSAAAQATSDAGVAEALQYIRASGLAQLTCTEALDSDVPSVSCSSNVGWANNVTPEVVVPGVGTTTPASCVVATTACWEVWIGTIQTYKPPIGPPGSTGSTAVQPAILRIHSTGYAANGSAARTVDVDVQAMPAQFPVGMYAEQAMSTNGDMEVYNESIFTPGTVTLKCPLRGFDYEYGIPAAVHAGGSLYYENKGSSNCGFSGLGGGATPAHLPACNTTVVPSGPVSPSASPAPGETIFDQDANGAALSSGDGCYGMSGTYYGQFPNADPSYPTTSNFNANQLAAYGYNPMGLTSQEYSDLKAQAQSLGTYYTTYGGSTGVTSATVYSALSTLASEGVSSPVVYFDFPSGTSPTAVDLKGMFPSYYTRVPGQSTGCSQNSVTVIVRHDDVTSSGNASPAPGSPEPVISLFAPEGSFSDTGGTGYIGTLFAENINMSGSTGFQLDPCFVASPPAGILDVRVLNFRSVDTVAYP